MKNNISAILVLISIILSAAPLALAAEKSTSQAIQSAPFNKPINYNQLNYDYRDSWGPAKNQENLHSCHVFATDALVEAEYARGFRTRINLSEGNLFLQYFLRANTKSGAEESIKTLFSESLIPNITDIIDSEENGSIDFDFSLLKTVGLKSESEFSYDKAVRFMGDLSYDAWLISVSSDDVLTANQDFLKNENDTLVDLFNPPKILAGENAWLQKLTLKTNFLFGLTNDQKREKIISALACKPVAVLLSSGFYEGIPGGHAVVLAGYLGENNEFLVRNSWGEEGFFFDSYETVDADNFLTFTNAYSAIDNQALPCPHI